MTRSEGPPQVWVDANVVLRLLTGQPEAQAQEAAELMSRADAGEVRLRICPLVVAEVVWVLTSAYDVPRAQVADVLTSFLASGGLVVEEGMLLAVALAQMVEQRVDFVDAYLAARARLSGAPVATFDGDFDRLGVERLALDA
ncbi:MAG: PIN domain-containing protein [Actinobacteria bacterium]|nr:PIN domain-containing protein [Actinomycetota bacterium]